MPILRAEARVSFSGQQSEKFSANPITPPVARRLRSGALQIPVVRESAIDRLAVYGIDYTDNVFPLLSQERTEEKGIWGIAEI